MSEPDKQKVLRYAELAMMLMQKESGEDQYPTQTKQNAAAIMTSIREELGMTDEAIMLEAAKHLGIH